MICKRCIVQGRVQGVWYRDTTRSKAIELGLTGSAVNLPDGSVEVIARGNDEAVEALCAWLWQGSPMSQVESVRCEDWQGDIAPMFGIG
jgi:acylphosphatase